MVATPIMRWLANVNGPTGQFNQTMVVQAPAGVTETDVAMLLQALLDRHAMLRLQVDGGRAKRREMGPTGLCRCPARARSMPVSACAPPTN